MEQKLGRYTIEKPLGEGSFAWVYRAFDQKLKRYVALKVLKPMWLDDPSAMRRFEQEATTMANLHHPHIAEIYDVDQTEGQVYLAQFLVEGETLAHRLTQGSLSWTETLAILKGVAAALDYAHDQGIIHRDLKPPNILLTQDGQPYLSDFGLIRAAEGSVAISSSSGGMVGTPSYMAPEQWRGQEASPATDVYALSCVAVEMLTGKRLFDGPSSPAIMTKHVMDPPQFPAHWPPDVPEGVTAMLQRGLAKDPAERISSPGELVAGLEALGATPPPVTAPVPEPVPTPVPVVPEVIPVPPQPAQLRRLKGRLVGGIVALLVVIIVGAILFFVFGGVNGDVTPVVKMTTTPTPTKELGGGSDMVDETPSDEPAPKPVDTAIKTPTSTPKPTKTSIPTPKPTNTPILTPEMIFVPAGSFEMGSDSGREDEQPVHTVTLDAFYMDQYEITNAQYAVCVSNEICSLPSDPSSITRSNYYGNPEYADYPVIHVSWHQAKTYCEWREARLPTEAEWEKAARGTDGRTYPWGETIDCNIANYTSSCEGDTMPVNAYSAGISSYGVYNMAGNVWEWVQSEFRAYPYQVDDGRENLTGTNSRVLRGGSWYDNESYVRATHRNNDTPYLQSDTVGFRCAAGVP
ncbi:MAG: SUMF1/EgtB/PvdO family nonheme iron enzyme [Anaerolineae bacterium]|nr:SUMF1/EgtB/PvdO family nonheme iron enzyme [Anaerolineae bacterium]